jgi:membrane fusion protein (multidrug efflux system)
MAAKNVGDGAIRAPFAGVVTERFVEVGEYVQSSSRVVSLAQVRDLKLEFSVPEANYPDVKVGATLGFRVSAYEALVFNGTVTHVAGAIRDTRDFLVEASVPNAELKLAPGMFADIELSIGTRELPSVPKSALFPQNGKQNLFVVQSGLLEQRVVQTEKEAGGLVPILRGVTVGEPVVTTYAPTLKNGQGVE